MTATETFYEQHASKGCAKPEPAGIVTQWGGMECLSCGFEIVVMPWLAPINDGWKDS